MRAAIGDGRFGPVLLADDVEARRPVVIRVFERVDAGVTDALLDALNLLCGTPLDHPSIAQPLAAGVETSTGKALPFLVQSYLPGTALDDFLSEHGPQPLAQTVVRAAQVAATIDFAAAAGVHHGVLGARDIILSDDSTGVTGFGLVQALGRSGIHVPGAAVSHADDIYALAAIAFQLLTGTRYRGSFDQLAAVPGADTTALRAALVSALAIDADVRPATALEFARSLQAAVPVARMAAPLVPATDLAAQTRLHEPAPDAASVVDSDIAGRGTWRFGDAPAPVAERADDVLVVRDPAFVSAPRVSPSAVLLVVAVVLIAAIGGFAGGFAVGTRTVSAPPVGQETSVAPESSSQPRPEGTQGRTFTEAPIDGAAPPADQPASVTPPPATVPATPTPAAPAPTRPAPATAAAEPRPVRPETSRTKPRPVPAPEATPAAGPGSMEVLSRPSGAQVYVDGSLVGRTPLSLPMMEPGSHAVRIALPGHQRWVTSVVVRPGDRTRVAASLELANDPQ